MSLSLSLYLCILSFALCYWSGRRSLVSGLIAVLGVGYAYGITRANVSETYSHFIFDAGVIGLYAAQLFRRLNGSELQRVSHLRPWLEFLIAWPLLLFLIPIQDWLIQFVGLRGSIFLLPFVLFGARLRGEDRYRLALWIAGLNLVAFAFAGAEYFLGLDKFFPRNHVTDLIYAPGRAPSARAAPSGSSRLPPIRPCARRCSSPPPWAAASSAAPALLL